MTAEQHDAEHDKTEHNAEHEADSPTARQLLHWATGDREAEAQALADAAEEEVTADDAELAVRRSHGDLGSNGSPVETDLASPHDAEAAHEERARRR